MKGRLLLLAICAVAITTVHGDSLNCRLVGYCDTPGCAYGVAVVGDYAYVADYLAGLRVISVSDPAHPTEVGYCVTPGFAFGVAVAGNYAYVADDYEGLRVISVADPAHPVEVGYYDTPGSAYGVAVVGDYAYVGDDGAGLQIYQFYGAGVEEREVPDAGRITRIPTIVRGVLMMGRQLTAHGLRPELVNAAGRKVMELGPGPNDVSTLAPGVYFVREAQAQAQAQAVRKVIVQR